MKRYLVSFILVGLVILGLYLAMPTWNTPEVEHGLAGYAHIYTGG